MGEIMCTHVSKCKDDLKKRCSREMETKREQE
jgi:hypothetical protein